MKAWAIAACIAMASWAAPCAGVAAAEDVDFRLRVAWGGGPQAAQTWNGAISAPGATLTEMQPLGIEADEAAALRLVENEVLVAPLVARAFDGCDVTVRGDSTTLLTVRLKNAAHPDAKDITVPLGELAAAPFRTPLDEQGGFLLVQRAPGDNLRVRFDRNHLVFSPSEPFPITVQPVLGGVAGAEPLTLVAQMRDTADARVLWETTAPFDATANAPLELEIPTPAAEGAYRLSLVLRTHAGLASKLQLWQQKPPAAARDVEFVVIDPAARLPRLTGKWQTIQTIDPANPKWWQRVPEWTQLDRLPVLSTPRSLGNVKLDARKSPAGRYVELPAPLAGADASWQAYPLAIHEVGQPHIVEIDLPAGAPQQLAVSIIEPDAAGRAMAFGREAGVFVDRRLDSTSADAAGVEHHRIVFWPRTASPILLLANQSTVHPAAYGAIRLGRRETLPAEPVTGVADATPTNDRLVAAYLSLPRFADCLGGAEELDPTSNLSVKGWSTYLEAANRLAQELRAAGYNAAVLSIAADGSSLAPIADLGASPKYDTGPLSSSGADPLRKDVLEALLRVFDREGLRIIPAIDLATPLPELERLRSEGDPRVTGIECVAVDGRTWREQHAGKAAGAHYNALNVDVEREIGAVVDQLVARYGGHASLGGVALQLSGRGYGVLPGAAWGLDDATMARFAKDTGSALPGAGDERFRQRGQLLAGPLRATWLTWRQRELTDFYAKLAERVQTGSRGRQLVLCTEDLFAGAEATQRLRQALAGRASLDAAASELGVDFAALAATPGVCALRPRRLASDERLQSRALDLLVNNAADFDHMVLDAPAAGELHFNEASHLRLASFDAASPFGAERTAVAMDVPNYPTGAALRRPLAAALAARDFLTLVEGGDLLPLTFDEESTRVRRLLQELPGDAADVRVERQQPITLRVYRTASATIVCAINESSWSATLETPLEASAAIAWRDLGVDAMDAEAVATAAEPTTGTRAAGIEIWQTTLPPYGIVARRFESSTLKVGTPAPPVNVAAAADLAKCIEQIEQRIPSLGVERPYPQLQNANFELGAADVRMHGWQARIGKSGNVEIAALDGATGPTASGRALHLESEDSSLGVAAQSYLFPMPASGQLTVRARVRGGDLAPEARMFVWIECDAVSGETPRYLPREGWRPNGEWSTLEVAFDDLPMDSSGQMRIQFHLVGRGEAWIDDVEMFDLRFGDGQQKELAKRLLGAKAALDDGRVADCQRLVEGYWPRFLVEYLPASGGLPLAPTTPDIRIATRPEDAPAAAPADGESPGLGDRVRHIFQR